jgi:hypothetical protein
MPIKAANEGKRTNMKRLWPDLYHKSEFNSLFISSSVKSLKDFLIEKDTQFQALLSDLMR